MRSPEIIITENSSSPDLPPGRDSWLREFLPSYFSTILVIPDNPEEGVLFLIKSALNAINKYSWDRGQPLKCLALLDGVKLLASACQETYPYSYQVTPTLRASYTKLNVWEIAKRRTSTKENQLTTDTPL